jgi:hypothetical protein
MKEIILKLHKNHNVNYFDPTVAMYEEDPFEPVSAKTRVSYGKTLFNSFYERENKEKSKGGFF